MTLTRPALPFWQPATLIATWFGSGLLPRMPGTWGSLAAVLCAWPLIHWGGWVLLLAASCLLFPIGVWAGGLYAQAKSTSNPEASDPGEVVVDEVVGQWVALLPLAYVDPTPLPGWLLVPMAFALFRLFDVWKPFPIGWLDRKMKGALGIMMDDVVAGLYAVVAYQILSAAIILTLAFRLH